MTSLTAQQVDAAVRAVLAELGLGRYGNRAGDGRTAPFAGRLLGLKQVEALPGGIDEVVVGPGTVVTPLARDRLKRLGIALRIGAEGLAAGDGSEGSWGFAIEEDSGLLLALKRSLLEEPRPWRDLGRDPMRAARWVAGCPLRGAVLFAAEGAVAAWRVNRVGGVRGASVADPEAVARAVRHLGANLLVVEPAGQPIPWLKQLCATFRRGGAPRRPEWIENGPRGGLPSGPDDHEDRRSDRPPDPVALASQRAERPVPAGLPHAPRGFAGGRAGAW